MMMLADLMVLPVLQQKCQATPVIGALIAAEANVPIVTPILTNQPHIIPREAPAITTAR